MSLARAGLVQARGLISLCRGSQHAGSSFLVCEKRLFADKSGNGEDGEQKKPWFQSIREVMNETKEK